MAGLGDATGWGRGEKTVETAFPAQYDGLWRLCQVAKYRRKGLEEYPLGKCGRVECGREYRQRQAWQKYCSGECRMLEWKKNHPRIELVDLLEWLEEKGIRVPPSKST